MRLRVRKMEPKDVKNCAALVAAHPEERRRYGSFLTPLASAWMKLLPTDGLNTTVVESSDGNILETVAVGVSAFIDDELLCELKTLPRAWIGPVLTERANGTNRPILTAGQIGEANSNSGLNLAIWTGVVSRSHADPSIDVELFRGFFDRHVGYRIKEILCQPLDIQQIVATFQAGLFWLSEKGEYVDGRFLQIETLPAEPFLIGGDREAAKRAFGSWFSGLLLSHQEVRMYLRPGEQRLLLAALQGLTDEELAQELGISLSAVKKTWRAIYDRTGSIWNGDVLDDRAEEADGKRGKEKKQHLLTYLRAHMEELRPVLLPRAVT
jgi:DNA-binding CsgD family transcriptional regulator